jgi:twin arginine-targeting protein translocase, TatA/E family
MGLGGISIWQLLIILVIVLLLFGTKRLRGLGGDLGGAIKGFKKAMTDEEAKAKAEEDAKQVEAEQSETADTTTESKEKTESK